MEDGLTPEVISNERAEELLIAFVSQDGPIELGDTNGNEETASEPPPLTQLPEPCSRCPIFLREVWTEQKQKELRKDKRLKRAEKVGTIPHAAAKPDFVFEADDAAAPPESDSETEGCAWAAPGENVATKRRNFKQWFRAEFTKQGLKLPQLLEVMAEADVPPPTMRTAEQCVAHVQRAYPSVEHMQPLTVKRLKSILQALGLSRAGRKEFLIQRLHLKFQWKAPGKPRRPRQRIDPAQLEGLDDPLSSGTEGETAREAPAARGPAGRLCEARVSTLEEEVSALGMNVLEDTLLDLDDNEKDVRAEELELKLCPTLVNPERLDVKRLRSEDVTGLTPDAAKRVIDAGPTVRRKRPKPSTWHEVLDRVAASGFTCLTAAETARRRENPAVKLDPTQKKFVDHVVQWAHDAKARMSKGRRPRLLRAMLLGTAGAGKSAALRLAVDAAREILGDPAVAVCAHTGVAAFNTECNAQTINSMFPKAGQKKDDVPNMRGKSLEITRKSLAPVRLLVMDEVSMVGSRQLAIVSQRLDEIARDQGRPSNDGFGGIGVILVGGFGQAKPIKQPSLILPFCKGTEVNPDKYVEAGQRLFAAFGTVFRLRRVHRQKGASAFKDGTLRLRDAAMTCADWQLWSSHDIDNPDVDPELRARSEEFLLLCAEHKICGAHNSASAREKARGRREGRRVW